MRQYREILRSADPRPNQARKPPRFPRKVPLARRVYQLGAAPARHASKHFGRGPNVASLITASTYGATYFAVGAAQTVQAGRRCGRLALARSTLSLKRQGGWRRSKNTRPALGARRGSQKGGLIHALMGFCWSGERILTVGIRWCDSFLCRRGRLCVLPLRAWFY